MTLAKFLLPLCLTALLSACGGSAPTSSSPASTPEAPVQAPKFLAAVTVGNVSTFTGKRSNYTVTKTATGVTVTDNVGSDGTVNLSNPSRLVFADAGIAYDLDGNAGKAYRIYQAAFNRTPDLGGLGYWIEQMDKGMSIDSVAAGFAGSAEFATLYGANPSNRDIVGKFYQNVLHRAPDQGGFDYWVGILDSRAAPVAGVLASFGDSPENRDQVAGYIANGINYALYKPAGAAAALSLGQLTACPDASISQSKDAFTCMTGSATGQTTFGAAACTLTIADTGVITLASGNSKQVVTQPYYSVYYSKMTSGTPDTFFLLAKFASTTYVGGLSVPLAGSSITIKVTSPKFAALSSASGGSIQADIADMSCKFPL